MDAQAHTKTGDEAWELARELVMIDSSDPGAYEGQIEGGRVFCPRRPGT